MNKLGVLRNVLVLSEENTREYLINLFGEQVVNDQQNVIKHIRENRFSELCPDIVSSDYNDLVKTAISQREFFKKLMKIWNVDAVLIEDNEYNDYSLICTAEGSGSLVRNDDESLKEGDAS